MHWMVLRRPVELARVTGKVKLPEIELDGNGVNQALANPT
jgi:hypothetical protein